jgi:pro-apoptotic serine protease NMA111
LGRLGPIAGATALCALLLLAPGGARASGGSPSWEATLVRVVPSVVALHVSATRPFDTEAASVSAGTGFVVDAERGLILTNRHVVQPGPVVADALFVNHERVAVRPLYRDPVHDFGFFQFDPEDVRFLEFRALELVPEAARVGVEIRVVGNDAGEKLAILAGTLARLDRAAPRYGRHRYNDFNTFYLQAASGTSGGSSGSPVIDRQGRVVGLNAGGRRGATSSFFLPLDRVVRALERIRAGEPVARGTLQAVFLHEPYDALRRLGLRPETEAAARRERPEEIGLLVVAEIVPGGPAHGQLAPGDVLLGVDGERVTRFTELEAILDDAVGRTLLLSVERGGAPLDLEVEVGDLHAITPDRYLEMAGGVFHPLSYQQARNFGVPVEGVYVTAAGYALGRARIPDRVVLTHVDGVAVAGLDAFEAELSRRPDGAPVSLRYFHLANPRVPVVDVARVDRRWFPMQQCRRDDVTGLWPCVASPEPPPPERPPSMATRIDAEGPAVARKLAASLVLVDFDVPFMVDGVQGSSFRGTGLVVDADRGLVLVDRDTVPIRIGDVQITFGSSLEVPGEIVALHPDHNLAIVRYDPALTGNTPLQTARLRTDPLAPGDDVWLVALSSRQHLLSRRSQVERLEAPSIPLPRTPRFRDTNAELVVLSEGVESVGGVLADDKGRVRAFWASFSEDADGKPRSFLAGIPAELVEDMVAPLRRGERFVWRSLGAELETLTLAAARARGLPEAAAERLEHHDPLRRRAIAVRRLTAGTPAAATLAVGDVILSVDGAPVTAFRELERPAQRGPLALKVFREGETLGVVLEPVALASEGAERLLVWAGALLQEPPRELASQRGLPLEGVYVAGRWRGSPAHRDGLPSTQRIEAADDIPTPDLEAFLAAVAGRGDRESVRLRTVDLEGRVRVLPVELDLHYWPTIELRRRGGGFERKRH